MKRLVLISEKKKKLFPCHLGEKVLVESQMTLELLSIRTSFSSGLSYIFFVLESFKQRTFLIKTSLFFI